MINNSHTSHNYSSSMSEFSQNVLGATLLVGTNRAVQPFDEQVIRLV